MNRHTLSVPDHRQQVPGREPLVRAVANPHLLWEKIRVRDRTARLAATLRLRAPVDTTVSVYLLGTSINRPSWTVVQQAVDLFVKDVFADQPTSVWGRPGQGRVIPGEELLVRHDVTIFEAL